MQRSRQGKLHHEWEDIIDEAHARATKDKPAHLAQFVVLGTRVVVVTSPQAAEILLRKNSFVPKWTGAYAMFTFLGTKTDSIISETQEEEHARLRKAFSSFYSASNMDATLAGLTAEVAQACDAVAQEARAAPDRVACVNILDVTNDIIASVVEKVFFESQLDLERTPFFATLQHMGQCMANPLAVPLVTHGLHPSYFRFRRNWHSTRKMWATLIREAYARSLPDATQTGATGSPYWACLRRAFPDALTDDAQWEGCVANTMLTYGAGVGGTAASIALALTALALDTESLTKLEKELSNANLLVTTDTPRPCTPTNDHLSDLPFLNAVFNEGLRMYPPAPSGTARKLAKDIDVCGTVLPKGTVVGVQPWGLHRCEAAWGADAKQWRPERWREGRSVNAVKRDASGALRWLSFSDGRQNCIGQQIATMEVKLGIALFVSRFHVELDRERLPHISTPEELALDCTSFITLARKDGLFLRLTPRDNS